MAQGHTVLRDVAGWLAWGGSLHWHDLLVLASTYALTASSITVGYHRLFTHRSFETTRALRAVFAIAGRRRSRSRATTFAAAGMQERIELRDASAEALDDEAQHDLAWVPTFFISEDELGRRSRSLSCCRAAASPTSADRSNP